MYKEILELKKYCDKIGVSCICERFIDGYALRFNSGGDVVQHRGSYGSNAGCVEFAIGSRRDYKATILSRAKNLVKRWKDKLNGGVYGSED